MDISCMKLLQHLQSCSSQSFSQCILGILAEDGPVTRDREAVRGFFKTHLDVVQASETRRRDGFARTPLADRQRPHQGSRQHFSPSVSVTNTPTRPAKAPRDTVMDTLPNSAFMTSWSSAAPIPVAGDICSSLGEPETVPRNHVATPCDTEKGNWGAVAGQYDTAYHGDPEYILSEAYRGSLMPQASTMHSSWSHNLYHAHETWGWSGVDVCLQPFQY